MNLVSLKNLKDRILLSFVGAALVLAARMLTSSTITGCWPEEKSAFQEYWDFFILHFILLLFYALLLFCVLSVVNNIALFLKKSKRAA